MKRGKEERRSVRRMEDPSVKEVILKKFYLPFSPVNLIFLFLLYVQLQQSPKKMKDVIIRRDPVAVLMRTKDPKISSSRNR